MKKKILLIEIGTATFILFIMLWIFIPKFIASQRLDLENTFPDQAVRQSVMNAFRLDANSLLRAEQVRTYKGELRIFDARDLSGLARIIHTNPKGGIEEGSQA